MGGRAETLDRWRDMSLGRDDEFQHGASARAKVLGATAKHLHAAEDPMSGCVAVVGNKKLLKECGWCLEESARVSRSCLADQLSWMEGAPEDTWASFKTADLFLQLRSKLVNIHMPPSPPESHGSPVQLRR